MKCGVAAMVLLIAPVSTKGNDDHDETLQGTWEEIVSFVDGKMDMEGIGRPEKFKIGTARFGDQV